MSRIFQAESLALGHIHQLRLSDQWPPLMDGATLSPPQQALLIEAGQRNIFSFDPNQPSLGLEALRTLSQLEQAQKGQWGASRLWHQITTQLPEATQALQEPTRPEPALTVQPSREFERHPPQWAMLHQQYGPAQPILFERLSFAKAKPLLDLAGIDQNYLAEMSTLSRPAVILASRANGTIVGYALVGFLLEDDPNIISFIRVYNHSREEGKNAIAQLGTYMRLYALKGWQDTWQEKEETTRVSGGTHAYLMKAMRQRTYGQKASPVSADHQFKGQTYSNGMPRAEADFLLAHFNPTFTIWKHSLQPLP